MIRIALLLLLSIGKLNGQVVTVGVSANDHRRKQPLTEALSQQFGGVAAELSLSKDGTLKCGNKLFEEVYLKPLQARVSEYKGSVYEQAGEFFLLLKVSSDSTETYTALQKLLSQYADLVSRKNTDGSWDRKAVRVIVGGNVPFRERPGEVIFAGIDETIPKTAIRSGNAVQCSSIPFKKLYDWKGEGNMQNMQYHSLITYIKNAKKNNRLVRVQQIPETPLAFDLMYNANVDFIEVEDLAALARWWRNRKPY